MLIWHTHPQVPSNDLRPLLLTLSTCRLFPSITPYDTQRFRWTKPLQVFGALADALYKDNTTAELVTTEFGYYDYKRWVDVEGKAFSSNEDMYRERTFNGDKFIAIQRENVSTSYCHLPTLLLLPADV